MPFMREEFWHTTSYCAEVAGVSVASFKEWGLEIKKRVGRGQWYDIRDVVAKIREQKYDMKRHAVNNSDDPADMTAADAKKRADLALAMQREAALAQMQQTLLNTEDARRQWAAQVVATRTKAMTISRRLAAIYETTANKEEFEREVEDEMRALLESLSEDLAPSVIDSEDEAA